MLQRYSSIASGLTSIQFYSTALETSVGENICRVGVGCDGLDDNGVGAELRSEPMILDAERLGAWSHSRWVCSCEHLSRIVVFPNR